jgi:hypothetical protein
VSIPEKIATTIFVSPFAALFVFSLIFFPKETLGLLALVAWVLSIIYLPRKS